MPEKFHFELIIDKIENFKLIGQNILMDKN